MLSPGTPIPPSSTPQFRQDGKGAHTGIEGTSETGWGVLGSGTYGVFGLGTEVGTYGYSQKGSGVLGDNQSDTAPAVLGTCRGVSGNGTGVMGQGRGSNRGVAGVSDTGQGVYGSSTSQAGVVGESQSFDGVYGVSHNPNAAGVSGHNPNGLAGYFEGNVTVTGDIVLANGADCAEDFSIGTEKSVEPGTVMVLGENGALFPSDKPYDKCVAGVVSGAGDFRPGIVLDKQDGLANRQPIALLGKVWCKVDATSGGILVGDLLTTSATPGHAMRAADRDLAFGAVIGKALKAFPAGKGLVPILIALQ